MGIEQPGIESMLMRLMADALAAGRRPEQDDIVDRILAGEDALRLELSGNQILVYLFGKQIAARSLQWFVPGVRGIMPALADAIPGWPLLAGEPPDSAGRAGDGVLVLDLDGVVRFANPVAGAMLRRSHRELVGCHLGVAVWGEAVTTVELVGPTRDVVLAELRVVESQWDGERCRVALLRETGPTPPGSPDVTAASG